MTCSNNGQCSGGGSYGGPGQGQGGLEIGEHEYRTPTYRGSAGSLGEQVHFGSGQVLTTLTLLPVIQPPQKLSSGGGGAAIKLVCNEQCLIEGRIDFSGAKSIPRKDYRNYGGGRGSGGSVWIITPTLTGNGTISANGADGQEITGGGAGGGGRVALDIWSHAFSGSLLLTANRCQGSE